MAATINFDCRLSTLGGRPYRLITVEPWEDREKCGATETLVMLAEDVPGFFLECFPQPVLVQGFPVIAPRRKCPGAEHLSAIKCSVASMDQTRGIDPFGHDVGESANLTGEAGETYSPFAKVTIDYESILNSDQDNTFLEKSFSAGGEFLSIPPQKIQVSENPPPEDWEVADESQELAQMQPNIDQQLNIYKRVVVVEFSFKWKTVLFPSLTLWARFFDKLGKVNERRSNLFNGAPPESVLFSGMSGSQTFRYYRGVTIGDAWSLDFRFSYRAINENGIAFGWNHVYIPSKSAWRKITRGVDGPTLYETTDLDSIFR